MTKQKVQIPRLMIAGMSSGSGKTTITCGILQALINRGMTPASFKCGPDYIDPMFHGKVIGTKSSNLDVFFCGEKTVKGLLQQQTKGCDIAVMEGVMGYYDGTSLTGTEGSSYHVATVTDTPAVLVVNCRGMSNSIRAIVKGFLTLEEDSKIKGLIFNQISAGVYKAIKEEIEREYEGRVRVLGGIPKLPEEVSFQSRHLGLVTAEEVPEIKQKLHKLAEYMEQHVDLDALVELASEAAPVEEVIEDAVEAMDTPVRIGVAYDKAFCFYYSENLKLFEALGGELVYFSPMYDEKLPEGIDGLILGGGYPELYATELMENTSMRESIRQALGQRMPCIAECGGFMYLNKTIEGKEMVGYLDGHCENKNKLVRFGYASLEAASDQMLVKKGETIRGHEFHYYDCTENGATMTATKRNGTTYEAVVSNDRLYAGYAHLHFYSNKKAAKRFLEACADYAKEAH